MLENGSHGCAGLRALQGKKELEKLMRRVKATRDGMEWGERGPPPLLIKMAPDVDASGRADIAALTIRLGLDGLVVGNTTISRPLQVQAHPTGAQVLTGSCSTQLAQLAPHPELAMLHSSMSTIVIA